MFESTEYSIQSEIHRGANAIAVRAVRRTTHTPVILKVLNREYPTAFELSSIRREYELMQRLQGDHIIRAYGLENIGKTCAIVLEDFGGESLAKSERVAGLDMPARIALAIGITDALIEVHQQGLIHKDINPANLVWNPDTGEVKVIDFGLSTELPRETLGSVALHSLEGTLPYISPEQTGRINRPIDRRSDLYSLGVTLYELFTGELPFDTADDAELVHHHIAKSPRPPSELDSRIPRAISGIILKLLSKTAEERFQSALGLKKDLEHCLERLRSRQSLDSFVPGRADSSDAFIVSGKFYGRESELVSLSSAFEKSAMGRPGLVLISGYSGIGKSSLVNEIRRPVTLRNGAFVAGKCNQLEQNVPYSVLVSAFRQLIKQFLAAPQAELDVWRVKLLQALGANGQLLVDWIPELGQVLGPQPRINGQNPVEVHNRLLSTFTEFVRVLAAEERPLVVFLDDLQWSDVATLELLSHVLSAGTVRHALFVGSYRDNEVDAGHPLHAFVERMRGQNGEIELVELALKPLDQAAVTRLIGDTLRRSEEAVHLLSEVVFQKTQGNPFFVNRVLDALYRRGALEFSSQAGEWRWDLEEIRRIEVSDNVVDFLVAHLATQPAALVETLGIAACIGYQFDLPLLAKLTGRSDAELEKELELGVQRELLVLEDEGYELVAATPQAPPRAHFAFAHDRIRQALLRLMSDERAAKLHLEIGSELLRRHLDRPTSDGVFEVVNHLNLAKSVMVSREERRQLATLNADAGNVALDATAFTAAVGFFAEARSCLSDEEWSGTPAARYELLKKQASAATFAGDFAKVDEVCEKLSALATTQLESAAAANIKALALEFQGRQVEAIAEIRRALAGFGITLPSEQPEIQQGIGQAIGKMQGFLARTPPSQLIDVPTMTDPEKLAAMQLLCQVVPPALQTNPMLYVLAALTSFELSMTHGTSALSAKCFVDCAVTQGSALGDYDTGYQLGRAAFDLLDKYEAETLRPAVYFVFTYVSHWRAHYSESLDFYRLAYRAGLEVGDMQHAAYARAHEGHLMLFTAKSLQDSAADVTDALAFLEKSKARAPLLLSRMVANTLDRFFVEQSEEAVERRSGELIREIEGHHNLTFLCRFFQYNAYASFIHDDLAAATKWNQAAENLIFSAFSDFPIVDHCLIRGLLLAAELESASEQRKLEAKPKLVELQKKLEKWMFGCPPNFAHKYHLLSARIAMLEKQPLETILELFEKASDSIARDDFLQYQALCHEMQGKFWLSRGREPLAKAFLREAHYFYGRWGATKKTAQMERTYAKYFTVADGRSQTRAARRPSSKGQAIDVISIVKATQAISSEIKIDKLLTTLMHVIVENAGAQRGALLLHEKGDELTIEALQDSGGVEVLRSLPYETSGLICPEIVQYVARTKEHVVLDDARQDERFGATPYVAGKEVKSVLCMPVILQNSLKGVVYLENNLANHVFTAERIEVIGLLASQASISIDNARLYELMEQKVRQRTVELETANVKLRELSTHDPLTSLHNRRYVHDFISEYTAKYLKRRSISPELASKRDTALSRTTLGLFLIDLDHFKSVNDTYGHQAGDLVLVTLAARLKEIIRSDDFLVRWGGEEFLIILDNTKREYLQTFAQKVLAAVRETPIALSASTTIHMTCSLGFVELPLDAETPGLLSVEQTLNLSDYALYRAKERGRNCAGWFKALRPIGNEPAPREHLLALSKNSVLDPEYFTIEYVE